jgi:hypothetical protein
MSALAMFVLKDPFLLAFDKRHSKNLGYNLGHNYGFDNYGLTKKLSAVFSILMMLAFFIDQVQQLTCWPLQEACNRSAAHTKRRYTPDL